MPTVIRPSASRGAHGLGADALLVAQAFPTPPLGLGGYPGGYIDSPPFAPGLQYPPDQPFPRGSQVPAAVALPSLPPRPPRCPLVIRIGRGLAAPARSRIVSGRPNCL